MLVIIYEIGQEIIRGAKEGWGAQYVDVDLKAESIL